MEGSKKMVSLYVGSTGGYSGKNLTVMGLGQRFMKDGLQVGYFKPFGRLPIKIDGVLTDKDAWFIHRVLMLKDPVETLCPVVMTHDLMVESWRGECAGLEEKILRAFETVSKGKDVVLMGGAGKLESGKSMDISGYSVVERLNAKAVLVDSYEGEFYLDAVLAARHRLQERLLGVIMNRVDAGYLDKVQSLIVPFLEKKGLPVLGVLPNDALLGAVMVGDVVDALVGDVLCCRNKLDGLIEHFLIGSMQVDRALEYIRKARNNAVIVGGDRADVQLAAIEAGTQCLILTGNLYPNEIVISRAEVRGVPIVVVRDDTYSVARKVEELSRKLRLREKEKVYYGIKLIEEKVDFKRLYEALGISL
ncbi:MAG: phosphotransacetylase family protein [Thermodesulfobacteriota bacterium]|nr:phosphotransacetylase family protein [Thermodesulfobacteriota bacterium]